MGEEHMDQSTRKLMMMNKTLSPRDDIDRLYVSGKEREGGITSIEDCVDIRVKKDVLQRPEITQTTQGSTESQ